MLTFDAQALVPGRLHELALLSDTGTANTQESFSAQL